VVDIRLFLEVLFLSTTTLTPQISQVREVASNLSDSTTNFELSTYNTVAKACVSCRLLQPAAEPLALCLVGSARRYEHQEV